MRGSCAACHLPEVTSVVIAVSVPSFQSAAVVAATAA